MSNSFLSNLKDEYSLMTLYPKQKNRNPQSKVEIIKDTKASLPLKTTALSIPFLLAPALASADTFNGIHSTVMGIFDAGVVLVIIFAGASWALGHRSKAIELLIGACCGYLLARHAVDIRDYLKNIG